MSRIRLDFTLAWRRLVASPGATVTMVAAIALGCGATLAVFRVLDPLLLEPLPVRAPADLVHVHSRGSLGDVDSAEAETMNYDRTRRDLFADVVWNADFVDARVVDHGVSAVVRLDTVSPNFFAMLGVPPAAGRVTQDAADAMPVVVLDFDFWSRVDQGDPAVIGREITIDDRPATIVGVAAPGFFGVTAGDRPDGYVMGRTTPAWIRMMARLAPGRTAADVEAALAPGFPIVAGHALPEVERLQHMAQPVVTPMPRGFSDRRTPLARPAWALMAMVSLLVAIAAANVAGVLLARQTARRREIAVELALGAGQLAVARSAVIDALLVAATGGAAGVVVGAITSAWLTRALRSAYGLVITASGTTREVWLTIVAIAVTILVAGVVPAAAADRMNLLDDLRQGPGASGPTKRARVLQNLFVSMQVGASITLAATAGLFLHSLANLERADTGFDRDRVAVVSLADHARGRTPEAAAAYADRLLAEIRGVPGVEATALSPVAPFSGEMIGVNVTADLGASDAPARSAKAFFTSVTPAYFDVLGLRLERGRVFTTSDDASGQPAIVLNATLARQLFGTANPIGARVRFVEGRRPPMTVVGVVSDSKYLDVREAPTNFAYLAWPRRRAAFARVTLFIRGRGSALDGILTGARGVVSRLDPQVTIASATTLAEMVDRSVRVDRAVAWLCSVLGAIALALVAVGLYGVLATNVARRTREVGLRVALGATTGDIVRLFAHAGVTMLTGGAVLGACGAALARSALASQLFHVPRVDVVTAAVVGGTVVAVACAAFAAPIWRATRTDPVEVLREG